MIKEQTYRVIGVMSGTSLDGLDVAYVEFFHTDRWQFHLGPAVTFPYTHTQKEQLSKAADCSVLQMVGIDHAFGSFIAQSANKLIKEHNLSVDIIASHGHTVLHSPQKGFTLQIGNGNKISSQTSIKTICDFRNLDISLGGQGAPLVPIADRILFSQYHACINLGGIGNISFQSSNQRIAFDICPVNIVLNYLANQAGKQYDQGGKIASTGKINHQLLKRFNAFSFYQKSSPKSLDKTEINEYFLPLLRDASIPVEDYCATFCQHIAQQIGLIFQGKPNQKILITGGGAFHYFLMNRIRYYVNGQIEAAEQSIINFKQAIAFAFLGVLKVRNEINCLKSVTGAKQDCSGGVIYSK